MAIMPSKYTDEIENSSYILGGHFLWVGIQNSWFGFSYFTARKLKLFPSLFLFLSHEPVITNQYYYPYTLTINEKRIASKEIIPTTCAITLSSYFHLIAF